MSHRRSSSMPGDVLCLEIGSEDDEFLGAVKSSAASAKETALRPRTASPSVVARMASVITPSQSSTWSQLQDVASTVASSREQQTGEGDKNPTECYDVRDKLNHIRCHQRRKRRRRKARSDDDGFIGEVKYSTSLAKPTTLRPRAASPSEVSQIRSLTASSESSTWSQLEVAASTAASSREQQTGEGGKDPAQCYDLRDKLNRVRCHRRRKPKRREARSKVDLRARWVYAADEGPSSFSRRQAAFLSEGKAGKALRRNAPSRNARRPRTYVDLDRPTEEFGNDDERIGGFPAPHYRRICSVLGTVH